LCFYSKSGRWSVSSCDDGIPNPATEVLTINSTDVLGAEISIVDVLGTEVLHISAATTDVINISSLRSGLYTVIVKTKGNEISRTFVKQ
jgi:hypothetical protein